MNCIFCNIVNKKTPATVVYEDNEIIAFVPLDTVLKGHTLVIPKQHYENIFDIDEGILLKMVKVIKHLSLELVASNDATGINILNANGKDAQQSVSHLHFHLVPRYPDDGLDMWIKQKL